MLFVSSYVSKYICVNYKLYLTPLSSTAFLPLLPIMSFYASIPTAHLQPQCYKFIQFKRPSLSEFNLSNLQTWPTIWKIKLRSLQKIM